MKIIRAAVGRAMVEFLQRWKRFQVSLIHSADMARWYGSFKNACSMMDRPPICSVPCSNNLIQCFLHLLYGKSKGCHDLLTVSPGEQNICQMDQRVPDARRNLRGGLLCRAGLFWLPPHLWRCCICLLQCLAKSGDSGCLG